MMLCNILISILCFISGFLLFGWREKRKIDELKRKLVEYSVRNQNLMLKIQRMSEVIEHAEETEE
ncbi:hypothetical protein JXB12_01445 [candidate division KSB1 bacterium]|nr:hypothetical protein [candidate division KSB1 bacterium]